MYIYIYICLERVCHIYRNAVFFKSCIGVSPWYPCAVLLCFVRKKTSLEPNLYSSASRIKLQRTDTRTDR